ncbi:MAG: YggS family pyridoxal phosphate-dependent enzyme [Spirochaetes bacterium]|nr:YggS family pyridoxal phosphate-dependent enzyme [Spirochaetota bacterium]
MGEKDTMIGKNVQAILAELPDQVVLVAAAKGKTPGDIVKAIEGGVTVIGENYCREAKRVHQVVGDHVRWHYIGIPGREKHDLLRKSTLEIFDMIETVDSMEIASGIDGTCEKIGKVMPILIEINTGKETQKSGVAPEDAEALIRKASVLPRVRIMGLMTMGPRFGNPEDSRPYFRNAKKLFDLIAKMKILNVEMRYLSMGMTNSYHVALEEGANMVRIGTKLFGEACVRE